ncbi:MAG: peptidoglycan DD-metalloendopeptidase family protein [Acidobacteriia bacterium]|nr:peptidoglycan DD-metalloendopeptidase family protein [Terriglobia bacterium]
MKLALLLCLSVGTLHAGVNPEIVDLAVGGTYEVKLGSGKTKTLRLISYREETERYFEPANHAFTNAVVKAEVLVSVDGVQRSLTGGPFHMPQEVNGLWVLVNVTRGWLGGIEPDHLTKDVRLEVADASRPFYDPNRFVFPIRNYRWRAMNYQHTYLGVVVNQPKLYYHRGEDMGMIPDREEVLAMTEGEMTKVPGPQGDGDSNTCEFEDPTGLVFYYAHMNAPNILPELIPGSRLRQGDMLGLTGNTWQGKPVWDPHLHVDVEVKGAQAFRHTFPIFVAAYRRDFPEELLPIAGGWRNIWEGGTLELDSSLSLAGVNRRIVSYDWSFTDGSHAVGPRVTRSYVHAGTYSEGLKVTDDLGHSELDFVEVFVLTPEQHLPPPYAWINYYPIRGIRPGTPVEFLTRYTNLRDVAIDFGDGTKIPWRLVTAHRYQKPGTYVVEVCGQDAGAGPGVFHVRLIVE